MCVSVCVFLFVETLGRTFERVSVTRVRERESQERR